MDDSFKLEFGSPPRRAKRVVPGGPGSKLRAFERALCLHGYAPGGGGDGRFANAWQTYRGLPETVRAALQQAAADPALVVSVGTHTPRDAWRYEPRTAHAVVKGPVPEPLEFLMVVAGFRENKAQRREAQRWFGWAP